MRIIDIEVERKAFQKAFGLHKIDEEWCEDGYYDSDVGESVILLWNGWLTRASLKID